MAPRAPAALLLSGLLLVALLHGVSAASKTPSRSPTKSKPASITPTVSVTSSISTSAAASSTSAPSATATPSETPSTSRAPAADTGSSSSLSPGGQAGVAVAVIIVGVAAIALIAFYVLKHRQPTKPTRVGAGAVTARRGTSGETEEDDEEAALKQEVVPTPKSPVKKQTLAKKTSSAAGGSDAEAKTATGSDSKDAEEDVAPPKIKSRTSVKKVKDSQHTSEPEAAHGADKKKRSPSKSRRHRESVDTGKGTDDAKESRHKHRHHHSRSKSKSREDREHQRKEIAKVVEKIVRARTPSPRPTLLVTSPAADDISVGESTILEVERQVEIELGAARKESRKELLKRKMIDDATNRVAEAMLQRRQGSPTLQSPPSPRAFQQASTSGPVQFMYPGQMAGTMGQPAPLYLPSYPAHTDHMIRPTVRSVSPRGPSPRQSVGTRQLSPSRKHYKAPNGVSVYL